MRLLMAGLSAGLGLAIAMAPASWAEPAVPTPGPNEPSTTSTTDELTDMVLEAIQHAPVTSTPVPPPAQ